MLSTHLLYRTFLIIHRPNYLFGEYDVLSLSKCVALSVIFSKFIKSHLITGFIQMTSELAIHKPSIFVLRCYSHWAHGVSCDLATWGSSGTRTCDLGSLHGLLSVYTGLSPIKSACEIMPQKASITLSLFQNVFNQSSAP